LHSWNERVLRPAARVASRPEPDRRRGHSAVHERAPVSTTSIERAPITLPLPERSAADVAFVAGSARGALICTAWRRRGPAGGPRTGAAEAAIVISVRHRSLHLVLNDDHEILKRLRHLGRVTP